MVAIVSLALSLFYIKSYSEDSISYILSIDFFNER